MEIRHTTKKERGVFSIIAGDEIAGILTYVNADKSRIIIDHTEVDTVYSGQGYGRAMVMEAVKYAREKDLKVYPLCSFARSVFRDTPEIEDVLYQSK